MILLKMAIMKRPLVNLTKSYFTINEVRKIKSLVAEVYAEKAEIYIMLCDFSSAIAHFKKALSLKYVTEWEQKLNQLYFIKGLGLIEGGYCNDALNLVNI